MKIVKKTKIEQDGLKYYDLRMPEHHNYVLGNRAVVHNCGTGVGFSVERQFVNELPTVAEKFYPSDTVIKVSDSKIGWASAFRQLLALLYGGTIPKWDTSSVRPAGAVLKTFGGRASGPEPLERLFKFCIRLFQQAAGRKLNSLECHDLMCMVGDVVVSGGVRRSALISLSNLSDERMRNAKNGQWWIDNGQRALANNSVAYTEKPDIGIFMKEWQTLYDSKSGERGIFNREGAIKHIKRFGRRDPAFAFGTNPCGEILLRPNEFCNLSEVVVRPVDTRDTLKRKIRIASILGTIQSTYTDFRYLRKEWKKNCEEERLLGVSLTGIMDNKILSTNGPKLAELLDELREYAVEVNKEWAEKLGINQSVAVTCIKPSGTVSQLVDASSGIHPRYSEYIERAVRGDKKDPIGQVLKAAGVKSELDVTKPNDVEVYYFPLKSPKDSIYRNDITAIEQLELYLTYKTCWTEHNPSITVYVREHEWLEVAAWVYKNFDEIGGVSFLPFSDFVYEQAPYNEVTKEEYEKLLAASPKELDWSLLSELEKEDRTEAAKELACTAGVCEIL